MKMRFSIFVTFTLFSFIVVSQANAWTYPISADVVWIEFNHSSNNNSLDIRKNYSTNVLKPEWYPGSGGRNEPIAYKAGDSQPKIYASFIITGGGEGVYSLYIDAAGSSSFGSFQPTWVAMSNGQGTSYFNATSWSIPGTVGIRNFYLYWEIVGVNGEAFDGYQPILFETTGSHKYYTVLDTPQSPMSEPWTKVLDYACNWAANQSTESEVITKITQKAYTDLGKYYYGDDTHAPGTTFYLTNFFNSNWADCRDMSAVVQVFTHAIGGGATQVRRIDGRFWYKPILPIGWSEWTAVNENEYWNFHQVAWNSNVYDACIKLNSPIRVPAGENINDPYNPSLTLAPSKAALTPIRSP